MSADGRRAAVSLSEDESQVVKERVKAVTDAQKGRKRNLSCKCVSHISLSVEAHAEIKVV